MKINITIEFPEGDDLVKQIDKFNFAGAYIVLENEWLYVKDLKKLFHMHYAFDRMFSQRSKRISSKCTLNLSELKSRYTYRGKALRGKEREFMATIERVKARGFKPERWVGDTIWSKWTYLLRRKTMKEKKVCKACQTIVPDSVLFYKNLDKLV